jgi:hypothetical protein
MIDALTTQAMWDLVADYVEDQKKGEKILASEVHAELMDFLAHQDIELPAVFQGNVPYELFRIFVDGSAVYVDNSYPDDGPQRHVQPVFIECGAEIPGVILEAYPALGDYFTKAFCPDEGRAADAAEVETESAAGPNPDDGLWQHVDMASTDGTGTASGWIPKRFAVENGIIDLGDERDWRVVTAYEGFVLNAAQMKLLPPTGYISDTRH